MASITVKTTSSDYTVQMGPYDTGNSVWTGTMTINGNLAISTNHTPSSATATGTTGTILWDSNYIYVCVATNTWKRASLSTW